MTQQLDLFNTKQKSKIHVEELTRSEQDFEMLRLTKEFCNDVDLDEHTDEDVLLMSCIRCRNDIERRGINCFIAYEGDKPIGFLVGVTSQAFHRYGVVAEQKLCYVTPTARGSLAVKYLIAAYEKWARINGATQLFTGTANKRYSERTSKLFEKLGYACVGTTHVKEI